ncbi:MAG: hypothetical protein QG647_809 [Patescibacteria group bacterium]|nr:hypothetical protein [Patescibacteria group bacterium]
MRTVKLSFSILNAWSKGQFEDAISMYLGNPLPENPYLELGKLFHEKWEKHILDTNMMPPELGGQELEDAKTEIKYQKIIDMGDKYQILLRGVIDLQCVEDNNIILQDHKCGLTRASAYVDSLQLDYYKLLIPSANIGRYACHNPYKCEALCQAKNLKEHICYGYGIKFLTENNAENALNHIITYGSEMIQYLESNRLLKDYKM